MAKREVWKAIPGHKGYEASSLGRIRSIDRKVWGRTRHGGHAWRHFQGKILKPQWGGGYLRVRLGKINFISVHVLVARTFIGPSKGKLVLHRDDNKKHNYISNIYYGSYRDNEADKVRNGNSVRGRHYRSKLTGITVEIVREIRASKMRGAALAKIYKVTPQVISQIRRRASWRWVDANHPLWNLRSLK
jgi:hypothetical protein